MSDTSTESKVPAPPEARGNGNSANPAKPQVIVAGGRASTPYRVGDVGHRQHPTHGSAARFLDAFRPNRAVSRSTMLIIIVAEFALAILIWLNSPFKVLPRPLEVWQAVGHLWAKEGLGQELLASFHLNLIALAWSTVISLGLSYLIVLPVFRPIVSAVSKGRFLSLTGFSLLFTLIFGGGAALKTSLLVFGMTVYYVTSMAAVISAIPKESFDLARTLRMKEWRVVWEVVILGTFDKALEVMRQNAAIGWMMLTMVEGIVRSEGGVGAMLLNLNKQNLYAAVFGVQILILVVALVQDYALGALRRFFCPYADLTLEKR